jgi:hypothetical protein
MFKITGQIKNFYLGLLLFLFLLIIFTPILIKDGISIFAEETLEVIIIAILLFLSLFIYYLYNRQLKEHQKNLDAAFAHIGKINLQVDYLKSAFGDIKKFPENKSDLKYIFDFLAEKVLGMINCDWAVFRIIETESLRTLAEFSKDRHNGFGLGSKISNKALVGSEKIRGLSFISSSHENLNIKTFCIISLDRLDTSQRKILESIANSLGMFYIIFDSRYYKNSRLQK